MDHRRDCYNAHSCSPCHGDPVDFGATQRYFKIKSRSSVILLKHVNSVFSFVILLGESDFYNLLDIWFPDKKPLPTAFLVDTSEEALLLPDWLKLRMIRSEVSRLVDSGIIIC